MTTGDKTSGGMMTASRGTDTMTATGGTAMRHDDGDARHNDGTGNTTTGGLMTSRGSTTTVGAVLIKN